MSTSSTKPKAVLVTMTSAEHRALKRLAKANHVSAAAWVRSMIRQCDRLRGGR